MTDHDPTPARQHPELLEAIVRHLPHAPCGHVAVGEVPEKGVIIGRKIYGGGYRPYCDLCAPVPETVGPMRPRFFPYDNAARAYNTLVLRVTNP